MPPPDHNDLPGVYGLLFQAITREIDQTRKDLREDVQSVDERMQRIETGMANFGARLVAVEQQDRDAVVRRETHKALRRNVTKIVVGASGVSASIAAVVALFVH